MKQINNTQVTTEKFKRGEVIVAEGERIGYVAKVKSGAVRLYKKYKGWEICLPSLEIFEDWTKMMVLSGEKSRFTAEALVPTEISRLSAKEYRETGIKSPEAIGRVLNTLMELTERSAQILGLNALGKVATMVVAANEANYPITHKLVASITGLTRETVTLQMLKLEKMGVIDNDKRSVKVIDKSALKKLVA